MPDSTPNETTAKALQGEFTTAVLVECAKRRWRQHELSRAADISPGHWSDIANNNCTLTLRTAVAVADALGMRLSLTMTPKDA